MKTYRKAVYWNEKQLEFLEARQPFKIFLGGRGSGKTTCEGGVQYQCTVEMPRSKGFLSSTTYNQLLTKTLPAMEGKWLEMGFVEGEDYVIGTRPPRDWEKPFQPPRRYENVVSWSNGRCTELLSMDRPDLARGGSYSDGGVDEIGLVPQDHVVKVLLPSLRGFRHEFDSYLYRNFRGYASIPWKPVGFWVLEYGEKAKADPSRYFFQESTAWDNVLVLGEEYIRMLEAELPYLEFLVEVMNERVRKAKEAFYHTFDPGKHTYTVRYLYGEGPRGIITNGVADPHYKPDEPLDMSFDFSGWFNCAIAFQEGREAKRPTEYGLHQFFVKQEEGKVGELVDKICAHYGAHKFKHVRLYGEPRGHDPKPDTPETLFQQIQKRFVRHGWTVEIRVKPGMVKSHRERNYYMNDLLSESVPALPCLRLNDVTCKDAIIAMQITSVKGDYQKDKGRESERLFPQEHAPHFTDLVDYFFSQKHGWRVRSRGSRPALSATIR